MNRYAILVPCRTGSARLPWKHFHTIGGRTVIEHLISRLGALTDAPVTIICPEGPENDLYHELEALHPVTVFRGDEDDVLDRFVRAATAWQGKAEYAVRVNGDCIAPSAAVFAALDAALADGACDVYTTVGTGVPSGRHVEAVRIDWLLAQADRIAAATPEQREHVFPLLYDLAGDVGRLEVATPVEAMPKLSIDTQRDLERMRHVMDGDGTDADIIARAHDFEARNRLMGETGVYLIAEIGGNHEGDFDYAKKLVREACETEVDAVKLQIYSPDLLVNSKIDPVRWSHFGKFALSFEQYSELFDIIAESGKHRSASVWSLEELEEHADNIDLLKVGSGDLNNAAILRALAALDKPLVISAGLSTLDIVTTAHDIILDAGFDPDDLAVLQCTSMYPIPEVEANLSVMSDFRARMDCRIGYSDHTVGYETMLDAVSAGAEVLEFHFSDDTSNAGFRDHLVSLDKDDTAALVAGIRQRMMRLGSLQKALTLLERSRNHQTSFRKGVFLRHDVTAGHVIGTDDLIALRPLQGIDAVHFQDLVGRRTTRAIEALDALSWEMVDGDHPDGEGVV